jgi:helicase MOV-10
MEGTRIDRLQERDLFVIKVPGLAENRPSVLRGDAVHIFIHAKRCCVRGFVHFVNVDELVVALSTVRHSEQELLKSFIDVTFVMPRTQERIRHLAIDNGLFLESLWREDAAGIAVL